MSRSKLVVSVFLVAFTALAAACGTQTTPTAAPATQTPPAAAPATQAPPAAAPATQAPEATPSGPAQVDLGKNAQFAAFLADDKGMTLYVYTKDTPGTSVCTGKCAAAWPPLLTSGAAVAGTGVDASKLGTITRADGSVQVTYNGMPLYYFVKDKQPGDVAGEGVGGVWYVFSPSGDLLKQ